MKSINVLVIAGIISGLALAADYTIKAGAEPKPGPVAVAAKVITGSSPEAVRQSMVEVRENLPAKQQKRFDDAIGILASSRMGSMSFEEMAAANPETIKIEMMKSFSGKTGEEVIAEAARIQAEREERELQQAIEEIKELTEKTI